MFTTARPRKDRRETSENRDDSKKIGTEMFRKKSGKLHRLKKRNRQKQTSELDLKLPGPVENHG